MCGHYASVLFLWPAMVLHPSENGLARSSCLPWNGLRESGQGEAQTGWAVYSLPKRGLQCAGMTTTFSAGEAIDLPSGLPASNLGTILSEDFRFGRDVRTRPRSVGLAIHVNAHLLRKIIEGHAECVPVLGHRYIITANANAGLRQKFTNLAGRFSIVARQRKRDPPRTDLEYRVPRKSLNPSNMKSGSVQCVAHKLVDGVEP